MAGQVAGKHVVIVGASNPTGLAIAAAFAEAGAVVDVLARTPEQAELIGLRLGAHPAVHASALDYASHAALTAAAERIEGLRCPVDHVVVCLRYGGRGDAVWGGEGEIGEVYSAMARAWLPRMPEGGSFHFLICGDRPSVGLQPQGPALVSRHEACAAACGDLRRVFLVAAGPEDASTASATVGLAGDPGRGSEKIVMPGAFVGDPGWEALLAARAQLDTRLEQGQAHEA